MKPLLFSVLPRPPHPTRDGLAIRNYYLLKGLAGEFRVRAFTLVAPHLPAGEYPPGVESREIPHAPRWQRRAAAAAQSLLSGGAYSLALYRSRRLTRALKAASTEQSPVWCVAHSYHMGPLALDGFPRAWIDFHNVDSEIWARVAKTSSGNVAAAFARLQASRVAEWEERLARSATGISCVSERDAQILSRGQPDVRPLVVPNGVDLSRYSFRASPADTQKVFFVGDLTWPPNTQAVRWLQTEIWPLVKRACAGARAEILGRGAPANLGRRSDPSFQYLGEGADTRLHWRDAAVAVVPLLTGGGTRLKILEAAACGVPVVSTRIGAEGLELEPEREILLRDSAESFASAVAQLLADPGQRARLARAARARVETFSDWGRIGDRFAAELLTRGRS